MTTTSLKLSPEIKRIAAKAAATRGVSAHAFMVDAIEKAASAAALEAKLTRDAQRAYDNMIKTGTAYDGEEVIAYLRKLARGKPAKRPKPIKWPG